MSAERSFSNLALIIPIPASGTYQNSSATLKVGGVNVTPWLSVDGRTFARAPLKRKVQVTKDGVTSTPEVVVPSDEYRAVR